MWWSMRGFGGAFKTDSETDSEADNNKKRFLPRFQLNRDHFIRMKKKKTIRKYDIFGKIYDFFGFRACIFAFFAV